MSDCWDLIVVGCGGIGSCALLSGARRGWRVLGLEQFGAAHDLGSSHGQTRIIRRAYFEHPNYVPMAQQAFESWRQIEQETCSTLLETPGLLQTGTLESEVIQGVQSSADQFGLEIERLSRDEIQKRWPVFSIPDDHIGLFEAGAGYLRVEKCVAQVLGLAVKAGAEFRASCNVNGWTSSDGESLVTTNGETLRTKRLVISPGAWAPGLLDRLGVKFQILRKQQHWFQLDRHELQQANGMCCFLMDTAKGCFYGFPQYDSMGIKVAEHTGGQECHADSVDREINFEDLERTEKFLTEHFLFTRSRLVRQSVCMYTMSPDSHFIVDRFPGESSVAFAAGLSGHGFKFAPVLGEHLVNLADCNESNAFDFLKLGRFSGQ
ncbi:MAG: N-methyl-L-tryptophan oxidase [Pirellulaceae bacterium]